VSDEFYSPHHKSAPPRQPQPGERIWETRVNHVTWSGELRFHRESYGWEAQVLRDGDLFVARRLTMRAAAIAWADELRAFIERGLEGSEGAAGDDVKS
jgi:hypothetical protein